MYPPKIIPSQSSRYKQVIQLWVWFIARELLQEQHLKLLLFLGSLFFFFFLFNKDAALPVDNNKQSHRARPVIFSLPKPRGLVNSRKIKEHPTAAERDLCSLCGHCRFSWFTSRCREVAGGTRGQLLCCVCKIPDVPAGCPWEILAKPESLAVLCLCVPALPGGGNCWHRESLIGQRHLNSSVPHGVNPHIPAPYPGYLWRSEQSFCWVFWLWNAPGSPPCCPQSPTPSRGFCSVLSSRGSLSSALLGTPRSTEARKHQELKLFLLLWCCHHRKSHHVSPVTIPPPSFQGNKTKQWQNSTGCFLLPLPALAPVLSDIHMALYVVYLTF